MRPSAIVHRLRSEPWSPAPHDVLGLQRAIGNQAAQRVLLQMGPNDIAARPGAKDVPRVAHGFTRVLVQRDVTSDIPIDSPEFFVHLRTRAVIKLVGWMGDSRQKLNEFVGIMGETETPSPWGSVALSWIQVAGTYGDIANAVFVTIQALVTGVDPPSTLFDFRNTFERNLDALSARVTDLSSDLPIYQALREAETRRSMGEREGPEPVDAVRANRQRARVELEQALAKLPSPDRLKQMLAQRWMASTGGVIKYETAYKSKKTGNSYSAVEHGNFRGGDFDPARKAPKPQLVDVERPGQTIKALRNAYGPSTPLHTLAIPMEIFFQDWGPTKRRVYTWKHDPVSRIWAPVERMNAGQLSEGLGSEVNQAVFDDWYNRGFKPTIGDLEE